LCRIGGTLRRTRLSELTTTTGYGARSGWTRSPDNLNRRQA
jgi:hypothetical protein